MESIKKQKHPIAMLLHQTKTVLTYLRGDEGAFQTIEHGLNEIAKFAGCDKDGYCIGDSGLLLNEFQRQIEEKDKELDRTVENSLKVLEDKNNQLAEKNRQIKILADALRHYRRNRNYGTAHEALKEAGLNDDLWTVLYDDN